jgi:hypothetical protein
MLNSSPEGVVAPDIAYSLESFKRASGLGTAALREARRTGLVVRRVGVRSFILGRDFLAWLERNGKVVGQDENGPTES